jgi:regulatory protein
LKVKQELSDEKIEKIVKESEFQTVYDKLLKFASLRPRSKKEYDTWLKKHKVHKSLHKELFNRLKRLDFLDDKKFAVWWVQQRQQFRPKSVRALRLELRNKGINKEIIEEALKEEGVDEYAAAKRILQKKTYMWKKYQGFEKRMKMSNFLARKGYSWDTVKKVVSEFDQG